MEVTVGLTAASMLVAGVGSTIYVASTATGSGNDAAGHVVAGSMTAEQLAAELQYAVSFTERSANAVEFTITDRDGDAAPETVRYEWSGEPGEPVLRTINGSAATEVAADVHLFNLNYRVQTVSETTDEEGAPVEGGETLLASFEGWSGITPTNAYRTLSTAIWASECFPLDWSEDVQQVNITKVRLMMAKLSGTGDYSVGIHRASGGVGPAPEAASIGTVQVRSGAGLTSSYEWQEITFSDVVLSDPTSKYCIVVKGLNSGARVRYLYSTTAPADATVFTYSTNSGSSWSPSGLQENYNDAPFHVYGTVTSSSSSSETAERHFVRSVGIGLQVGSKPDSRVDTAAEVLNAPEVAAP